MVRFMPASCFHTGSARLRLRGLPVRMAMPRSTPADTARQSVLHTLSTDNLFLSLTKPLCKRLNHSVNFNQKQKHAIF